MAVTVQPGALAPNDAFIGAVVVRYLGPSVLAMIGTRISSLANGLILGNALGAPGLSALSIVSPVSLVYLSLGSLIGVGASVLSGIAIGRSDREHCDRVYSLAYALSLAIGLSLMIAGLLAADEIASALGAEGEIFRLSRDFIRFAAMGGTCIIMMYTPLNYLRLCGKSKQAMAMLLIMSGLNTGLSALFVLVFGMKTDGVALSSGVGALAACLFGLYCLWGPRSDFRFGLRLARAGDAVAILGSGSPSALNNVCRAMQYFFINLLFVRVAPAALPAYAIVCAAQDVFLAVILGFSQIMIPLVGIAYGEKDGRCIRAVTKRISLLGSLSVGVCALLLLLFRSHIGVLFGMRDGVLLPELRTALLFLACSLNASFLNNVACSYFNVTRRATIAGAIAVCRLFAFMVVPSYLLAGVMRTNAVWVSILLSEMLTLLAVSAAILAIRGRNKDVSRPWRPDDAFATGEDTIDFSVANTNEDAVFASARIVDFCDAHAVPRQKSMCLSLAIEEILVLLNAHSFRGRRGEFADVRVSVAEQDLTLRIRNAGARFNPLDVSLSEDADAAMGMEMILKMAKKVEYKEVFGVNNLVIVI